MNEFFILCSGFELGRKLSNVMNLKLSLCMCAPEHLNWDRISIGENLNCQNITNLRNLDPKITKNSFNLKIKTSSPPTPYYSTEHISSTSQFDLLRQQSENFYFRVSGVAGDRFLMNFTSLINFHYEWIFHPMFRFWAPPQTMKYHESEALLLHVHSWTPK